jgi:hypothetical protein
MVKSARIWHKSLKCVRIRLAVSHPAGRELAPQPQPHFIRGPCGRPRLALNTTPKVVALKLSEVGHALACLWGERSSLHTVSPHEGNGKLKHAPPAEMRKHFGRCV